MTEDPTLKQDLQIPQRFAGDRGHGHPTHPTASGWIEHPLRYFQTPSLLVLLVITLPERHSGHAKAPDPGNAETSGDGNASRKTGCRSSIIGFSGPTEAR